MADSASIDLAKEIEFRANELGFDRIGFAPAAPPLRAEYFKQWLAEGKAGTMTYLNRSAGRRVNPQVVMDGARTIISVAQSYFTGRLPEEIRSDPSRGLIASYAWGQDYHEVLLNKLVELAGIVEELAPGYSTKCYVDTGHILERDHGERAGLGFIGKNTLLISPQMGSTFFLGEILTTLKLPPSPLARMPSCGSCTRCLDICPTHAFPTAYVLDSTLCVSYLTIEFRGVIPRHLRAKMSNHVFGCDDCQDCCPWNLRFSKETNEAAYRAALDRQAPLLSDLVLLTENQFRERFAGTAVLRTAYSGFMRNVAIALGNWGAEDALDLLEPLSGSNDALIRTHAVWGVAQVNDKRADKLLRELVESETREEIRLEIMMGIEEREERARDALTDQSDDLTSETFLNLRDFPRQ